MRCIGWLLDEQSAGPLRFRDRVDTRYTATNENRRAENQIRIWTSAQWTNRAEAIMIEWIYTRTITNEKRSAKYQIRIWTSAE
jgi:hypothetical protein